MVHRILTKNSYSYTSLHLINGLEQNFWGYFRGGRDVLRIVIIKMGGGVENRGSRGVLVVMGIILSVSFCPDLLYCIVGLNIECCVGFW